MSIVCAAIKHGEIAISADSLASYGALKASREHLDNSGKLCEVNDSVIGLVGWCAVSTLFEHLIAHERDLFRLGSRMEIFDTLLILQHRMKNDYLLETRESRDQPVESIQLDGLIVNANGLFEIGSYREVNQFRTFWAVGSGKRLSLGAMHAHYAGDNSASEIAEAGVRAAAEFDDSCRLPLETRVVEVDAGQRRDYSVV